jgi:hypothetical protein
VKYKVDDYLAATGTVLLKVVVAFPGELEVYGLLSCKSPTELRWYTIAQLDHDGFTTVYHNPLEFESAEPGDRVVCGPDEYRSVLAAAGKALLLSQSADKTARFFANAMKEAKAEGGAPIPDELISHMAAHGSTKRAALSVDGWYDREIMALMNWHLARE